VQVLIKVKTDSGQNAIKKLVQSLTILHSQRAADVAVGNFIVAIKNNSGKIAGAIQTSLNGEKGQALAGTLQEKVQQFKEGFKSIKSVFDSLFVRGWSFTRIGAAFFSIFGGTKSKLLLSFIAIRDNVFNLISVIWKASQGLASLFQANEKMAAGSVWKFDAHYTKQYSELLKSMKTATFPLGKQMPIIMAELRGALQAITRQM
jgi:hypothetical protein